MRGMAYPYGTWNDTVIAALRTCGIAYARTVVSTNDFRLPENWLRLNPTCHHGSPQLMELAQKFIGDRVSRAPYLFYLWGHAYEFDANKNWNVMEEFSDLTGGRDDVWYATNMEVYEYVSAYRQLVFGVDGELVKNPTGTDIWFSCSDQLMQVRSGSAVDLSHASSYKQS